MTAATDASPDAPTVEPVEACPVCGSPARRPLLPEVHHIGVARCSACELVHATGHYAATYLSESYYAARAKLRQSPTRPSARDIDRKRRNAVSLMVGLGESAVPDLCRWVAGGSDAGRWVASRALAAGGSSAAADCLINAAGQATDPSGRAAALEGLRLMLARESLSAEKALDAITAGAHDTDPGVQQAAVTALAMLDFDHADPALAAMEASATPEGAAAAKAMRARLTRYRKLNPDLPY